MRTHLEAGEPQRALEALARLGERAAVHGDYRPLEDAVKDWLLTIELADRGEFALAMQMFARVQPADASGAGVEQFRASLEERQGKFNAALPPLHEAVDQRRWRDVLPLAEAVLAVAPQHAEARTAKSRAWTSQAPETIAAGPRPDADTDADLRIEPGGSPPKRFLLWIDGVGGYLVCLGPRVTFGQATPDGSVDVPLFADVSRLHATRDAATAKGYVLEAVRPLQVNGQTVTKATAAARRPGDARRVVPVPVPAAGAGQHVGPARPGERPSAAAGGGRRAADGRDAGARPGPAGPRAAAGPGQGPVVLYRHKDGLGVRYAGRVPDQRPAGARTAKACRPDRDGDRRRISASPSNRRERRG